MGDFNFFERAITIAAAGTGFMIDYINSNNKTLQKIIINVAAAVGVAMFLAPAIGDFYSLSNNVVNGIAFAFGYMNKMFLDALYVYITNRANDD